MAISGADIKVGIDILSRIFKIFKRITKTKAENALISNIYKELLMGDKADYIKIEAMLLQIEKSDCVNPEYLRVKNYYDIARNVKAGYSVIGKSASCKKVVKKKVAKPVSCRKVANNKSVKPKSRALIKKHTTKFKGVKK